MRRGLSLLLCALLLLTTSCAYAAVSTQREADTYALYFRENDLTAATGGDALRAETVQLPELADAEIDDAAEMLLRALLKGPVDETLRTPFPTGTTLLSLDVEDSQALVDLSAAYGGLSGVALTMADYAITLTLTQLPEITEVRVTVRGQELGYRDRQTFRRQDLLLTTTEDIVTTLPVTLYFVRGGKGMLGREERVLDLYEGDTQVSAVVKALGAGPEEKGLSPILPEDFQVRSVWLEDDVCFVNFSSAALAELPEEFSLELAKRAIIRSLRSLDTVEDVRFLVDGERVN